MKQAVKTILTIFFAIFCLLAAIFSFGYYLSETDYMEYEAERMIDPIIKEVKAHEIGKTYNGESEEGYTYYRLDITMENPGNYGKDGLDFYFNYNMDAYEDYYYVRRVDGDISFTHWDNDYYMPPAKETTIFEVVKVEDGCERFDLVYYNYQTELEQKIPVDL